MPEVFTAGVIFGAVCTAVVFLPTKWRVTIAVFTGEDTYGDPERIKMQIRRWFVFSLTDCTYFSYKSLS